MNNRRLRIVVSTPTFLPLIGGAELGIHEIYSRLAERHDVIIVTPRLAQKPLDRYGADDYLEARYEVRHLLPAVERLGSSTILKILRRTSLAYLIEIAKLRRCGHAEVVNFHFVREHGLALVLLRRLLRTPVVLSLVGRSDVQHLMGRTRRTYTNLIVKNADITLPISAFYLRGRHIGNMQVVPYGVDTKQFAPDRRSAELRDRLGITEEQLVLLSVQRLASVKRVDVLIRMMAQVIERRKDAVLVLIGQGDEETTLRRLVADLGLDKHVRFAGYVSSEELPDYFASADIFVFHSMLETFGIVFAQAMASGLPIVAANTSCVPDVVHPDNGTLVEPFDIDSFCDAVVLLANDPSLRRKIGRRNRVRAKQEFDWDLIADRYEQILIAAASG